ncbi:MAG: ATP-binding cassette domain-containing protein [Candidatus Omnitrophica bacterium]|nr:ATP-binding cassette domain-containing protein [Candidatus Omnitrophota bacterium]MBU4487601.1 ATP-binding cassette domain-containing protein [Candidatus Omnitrophota bacterium]MCG2705085.1 ATP-binding cassette domain-containing protein [Candidatus Omnitrophota bacterium]
MITVKSLSKYFPIKRGVFQKTSGFVKAVDDISFSIGKGETFALVGESGSGKTTAGRLLLGLLAPNAGDVVFDGRHIFGLAKKEMLRLRKDMQMIFQDPFSSLNPRMNVRSIISEGLILHGNYTAGEIDKRCDHVLETVDLKKEHKKRYPHQFSGGERQRIGIARAVILEPKFIVCDEPVSSLDVSIRAKILTLLADLKTRLNLTYLFISHDLSVVANIADHVAVMYNGKIVETGDVKTVYTNPRHEYTKKLLKSIPIPDPRTRNSVRF